MPKFQPGQMLQGVQCKGCAVAFPFEDQDDLPLESFRVVCPRCGADHEYQPEETRSLLAHRKQ
ncbi:MAG: hypothetical protein MH112_01285 [Phenylobacterium sp.]|uniref:hypothetical protein n=1 Tax=Phenylobacterium sp. TaxID=1871053 RepID=UPI0025F35327|nr:hypothetical protein [Phenylobacterium sp.]MCG9914979.1 hypothetical protein [Phenylobacterium sp.]